jgi:hypothetical protein
MTCFQAPDFKDKLVCKCFLNIHSLLTHAVRLGQQKKINMRTQTLKLLDWGVIQNQGYPKHLGQVRGEGALLATLKNWQSPLLTHRVRACICMCVCTRV